MLMRTLASFSPWVKRGLVMPETKPDLTSATFDIQMFMGGKEGERTMGEWERLFARSGVVLVEVVDLASFAKMMVVRSKCP